MQERRLPELDDELAKSLGEFDSLDALKDQIRSNLENEAERQGTGRMRDTIRQQLLAANPFDVPDSVVDRYLDAMIEEQKQKHQDHDHQGHDHAVNETEIRDQGRPYAIGQIRTMWILEKIAQQEGIEVTDQEIDENLAGMAASFNADPHRLRVSMEQTGRLDEINRRLADDKVYAHIEETSEIEEVTVDRPEE